MPEFMMLMKSGEHGGSALEWEQYINSLMKSGMFRGGSALGNGVSLKRDARTPKCLITGYMRFEAESVQQVVELVPGNPVYEAGGEVEVLEAILT